MRIGSKALRCAVVLGALTQSLLLAGDLPAEVDQLFARWDRKDSPGCALAVVREGCVLYKRGYGMANLELSVPITPEAAFYVGSVSKQFVAACVGLLVLEGRIDLEDDIRKYIPELPDYGPTITIRHLIHHTSGIRDYLDLEDIAGIPIGTYHERDVLELIARQKELNFPPGEEYLYSNSGYFLLGVIVARASGKSLRRFAKEHIFIPLGMKASRFHDNYTELIYHRASGYFDLGKGMYRNFISTFDCVGSGGLFTTVEDLVLWDRNFDLGKVGGMKLMDLMHTRGVLNSGEEISYAWGLVIGTYRGVPIVEHAGSLGGYRAEYLRFPEQKFSVILLSNVNSFDAPAHARRVADLYLSREFSEKPPPPQKIPPKKPKEHDVRAGLLKSYAGSYTSEELGVVFRILFKDRRLYLSRKNMPLLQMRALTDEEFRVRNWRLQFLREAPDDRVKGFRLTSGRVRNLFFKKTMTGPSLKQGLGFMPFGSR